MADIINIKKGLDIPIGGHPLEEMTLDKSTTLFAIVPDDYPGCKWKPAVKAEENVLCGSPLLTDKDGSGITLVSPVEGEIVEIRRGERRKIEAVVIRRTGEQAVEPETDFSGRIEAIGTLCRNGLWACLRQRPYDIIPSPTATIRDIFVTAFDTAPLAPPVITPDLNDYLEEGLRILKMLTDGDVYLSTRFGMGITSKYAKVNEFTGPHPAGNVGTQIAAIRPVNKGETVVTLDARTAARIGQLSLDKTIDFSTIVALTGDRLKRPHLIETTIGASLSSLLENQIEDPSESYRVISGSVLTGTKEDPESGFLRYPYRQVTVISEGDSADEFIGWASMDPGKYSVKRSFLSYLQPRSRRFSFDSRVKGGHRAMILSGEYDKVFPFDIYPEFLIKAILAKDIDKMEKLGIYEVAPEDFALPEFIDTSKNPLQQIVREGLDYLRAETE